MPYHPSVDTMSRSEALQKKGRKQEALALAEAAWKMFQEIPGAPPEAALSGAWYGFLLGHGGRLGEGLRLCRDAVKKAFWDPRAHAWLARLELAAGHRREALGALEQGLKVSPEHRELQSLRRSLGMRRPPPIPFLDRRHPINRFVGRLLRKSGPLGSTA